ncbi:MAG: peptidase C14 [Alphaproteobacteria bacterium]|nr:peptidase C14 [Alphaproteobacteria bacterium]
MRRRAACLSRSASALSLFLLGLAALLLLANGPPRAQAQTASSAEDLFVVDCLLPGQMRRLGTRMTYVGARRAIKTTNADCAIRGGEYVAYDRASHASALQVWLPLAEAGDAAAQTYVGEIYEKGLGVPPQFDATALWYRRAAELGNSRAQVNLGSLYERGLGMAKDPEKAVEWYRRASGLEAGHVPYVPASVAQKLEQLRGEHDRLTQERDALGRQLDAARQQLERSQRELNRRQSELEQARKAVSETEAKTKQARAAAGSDPARLAELERELQGRRQVASQQETELGRLRAEIAGLGRQSELLQKAAQSAEQGRVAELARYKAEAENARSEAALLTQQLQLAARTAAEQRLAAEAALRQVETARGDLQRERASAQRDEGKLKQLEARLAEREAELQRKQDEAAAREAARQVLEREVAELRRAAESEAARQAAEALAVPRIEIIDPPLPQTRGAEAPPALKVRGRGERVIVGRVSAPGGLLALLVNDREIKPESDGLFRANVPVSAPQTDVAVVAIGARGARAQVRFQLVPEGGENPVTQAGASAKPLKLPDVKFGNFRALVIGNNKYASLAELETAENDARAVAELLGDRYGFKATLLLNASRYQMLSALNKLREELSEDDNLLIYYAGHGALDRVNQRGFWLPVDAEESSPANWISNIQITDMLNAMAARKIFVIADSCYSGTLTRSAVAQIDARMSEEQRGIWIKTMAAKRSRVVLSSGGIAPVLDGGGGNHLVFAKAFLSALRENADILEGQRLYRAVATGVAGAAASLSTEQLPQFAPISYAGHEAGDFFLVPG